MQNLVSLWSGLSLRNQVVAVVASLAMFGAVLGIGRMAAAPDLALLYSGLEPQAAGQIMQSLEEQGVLHEVRGGAIFVERQRRDALRMSLAAEGLPSNNAQGYELLESLTGFGTTAQMFDAAYWRAKEGELARKIVSSPAIHSARVHIANAMGNPFQRGIKPTASVTITSNSAGVEDAQVRAIRMMVASAVAGMRPEDVAVIDSVRGLLAGSDATPNTGHPDEFSETLRDRAVRLLEARVGTGNAMVEVNIATEADREVITERMLDPGTRVAISTDSEEETNSSENTGSSAVTVASNLPDGDAQTPDGSRSTTSQIRERVNFEVSETRREIQRDPGKITRITVAVLVNEFNSVAEEGQQVTEPRSEEELQDLRDLVASAVGIDENRGDIITIKSMAFTSPIPLGTEVSSGFLQRFLLDPMTLIQLIVLAAISLIIGFFVLRPIFLSRNSSAEYLEIARPRTLALSEKMAEVAQVTPLIDEITASDFLRDDVSLHRMQDINPTSDNNSISIDPVERLRTLIAERQDETVEILRGWLENKSEKV